MFQGAARHSVLVVFLGVNHARQHGSAVRARPRGVVLVRGQDVGLAKDTQGAGVQAPVRAVARPLALNARLAIGQERGGLLAQRTVARAPAAHAGPELVHDARGAHVVGELGAAHARLRAVGQHSPCHCAHHGVVLPQARGVGGLVRGGGHERVLLGHLAVVRRRCRQAQHLARLAVKVALREAVHCSARAAGRPRGPRAAHFLAPFSLVRRALAPDAVALPLAHGLRRARQGVDARVIGHLAELRLRGQRGVIARAQEAQQASHWRVRGAAAAGGREKGRV